MNRTLDFLRPLITDLNSVEKRKLSFEILDFYAKKAETISDFDVLGELALKSEHRDLYIWCAESAYSKATTNDQLFAARTNLISAYNALNEPEKALFYIDLNIQVKPGDFDLLMHRAFNLALMGKREEAEALIESLINDGTKTIDDIRYALSGKMLRNGETAAGILNFIDTFKPKNPLFEDVYKMEKWIGQPRPGKTIFVNGEGGIGDELINIRFFEHLKQRGMNPILYSSWSMYRPDIVNVFRRHGHHVITDRYSIDESQIWTNMMPLPGYLGLSEEELWTGPYLTPLRQPKNEIRGKFKIGIKNAGNPYFSQDQYRKMDFNQMVSYLPEHADIYYIGKDPIPDNKRVVSLDPVINSWEDTLDFIDQMDIIVSSCTSLVHAAGAMGKRTIVMVPIAEYYVWTSTRKNETTPWYGDNFTVLKQSKIRSWVEPLTRMREILDNEFPPV